MSAVYGLLLQAKGDIKRIKLKDGNSTENLTEESLQTIIKKKTPLVNLGSYKYSGVTLTLFGYTSGKAGTENKHELPPPLDETVAYSDILLIASKEATSESWTVPISYSPEHYEKFYQSAFNGGSPNDEDESDDEDDDGDDASLVKEGEEEELIDSIVTSKKKKAAEEDGVPEDEDGEVEEEDDDEGDEEEGDEEGEVVEGEDGGEVHPVKKVSSAKKKVVKTNLTVVQNTGRANQQKFTTRPGFQPITSADPIPTEPSKEATIRTRVMNQIVHFLGTNLTTEEQKGLELCIYKSALADSDIKYVVKHFDNKLFEICYMNAARRYIGNLSPNTYINNTTLLQKVKNGDLTFDTLSSMTSMDLAPHMYSELRERQTLREQQQLEGNKSMATDMFKCGRCHKREATFYELQTRSADEPMTKFISCVNCGNRWRM